ncbi:MAG: thioesterase [Defluviitaleaceae bacterium]|nr:thioesterase [Defluviitaleaceae bacterium]
MAREYGIISLILKAEGVIPMYTGTHRINYYELDLNGRLKLSALSKIVQTAADINATEIGVGFKSLVKANMSFVLQRFAFGIERLPEYDETVEIRTWPSSIERGTWLRKGDGALPLSSDSPMVGMSPRSLDGLPVNKKLLEWTSQWILFDIASRKILRPSALPVSLTEYGDNGVTIAPRRIVLPQSEVTAQYTHTVRRADVDTNNHMNNSVYLDLVCNVTDTPANIREIQINYLAEARLGEEIIVTARQAEGSVFVAGEVNGRSSFIVELAACPASS